MSHVHQLMEEPLPYVVHHSTPTAIQQPLHSSHTQHSQHVRRHRTVTARAYDGHTALLVATELSNALGHVALPCVQQQADVLRHHVQLSLAEAVGEEANAHSDQPLCLGGGEEGGLALGQCILLLDVHVHSTQWRLVDMVEGGTREAGAIALLAMRGEAGEHILGGENGGGGR